MCVSRSILCLSPMKTAHRFERREGERGLCVLRGGEEALGVGATHEISGGGVMGGGREVQGVRHP